MNGSAVQMGFRSIETPKIRKYEFFGMWPFGWASEVWKNQVSIGCSEERENSKIRSGGYPYSEELENFKDLIWWASEERKTKKPKFVRSGELLKNENPKIRKFRWASDERKPKDKDS
ncbi:hypothetical protein RirG_254290 [Rhizophagus irregularis DAOM 197198w]|uniref:Uncharacterized protein n=1 Tax=Rhizophagus irregularis (strain DAOM 197198w) TaxID=1432141 RepID=A0A015JYR5_RHIIW|nr:hypothetical protein RirG_254290 [Rhizophagus irregularis DAOM 197198w]